MKHITGLGSAVCLLFLLAAPASAELSEPERSFEHLWQTFDRASKE